jgi:hypothetical protein
MKTARMPRFPDSPEGVALALAYLILQENGEKDPPPDLIKLYQECVAVVNGSSEPIGATRH